MRLIGLCFVQAERAFEHLATYHNQPERNIRFQLTCGHQGMRGIYLRDSFREKPEEILVKVDPIFYNSTNIGNYYNL